MGLKEAYIEKLDAQLREWGAKIDLLKAKADKAEAGAKIELHKQLDAVRARQESAQAKLKELQAVSEDAWETLKDGSERAWHELKVAVESATSKFK